MQDTQGAVVAGADPPPLHLACPIFVLANVCHACTLIFCFTPFLLDLGEFLATYNRLLYNLGSDGSRFNLRACRFHNFLGGIPPDFPRLAS